MDKLTQDYQRASEAEAGRPAAASRAAILAEARRLAAERAAAAPPASANEPWFKWRYAASVLVAGVALLVWRQVGREGEPLPQVMTAQTVEPMAPAASPDAARRQASPSPPPPPAPAPAPREEERNADAAFAARSSTEGAASAKAAAQEPVTVDLRMREAVPETAIMAPPGSALLRQFPDVMISTTPVPGVWLLVDDEGRTVRSGVLQAGEDFGSALRQLQAAFPDHTLAPFEVREEINARGLAVPVGVARLGPQGDGGR